MISKLPLIRSVPSDVELCTPGRRSSFLTEFYNSFWIHSDIRRKLLFTQQSYKGEKVDLLVNVIAAGKGPVRINQLLHSTETRSPFLGVWLIGQAVVLSTEV